MVPLRFGRGLHGQRAEAEILRASGGLPPLRWVLVVIAFLCPGWYSAAEAEKSFPDRFPITTKDCQLTWYARQALLRDEELGSFNLGVSVHSATVTLWGTVPSAALARRAEEQLRKVPGLGEVCNQLRIVPPDNPTEKEFPSSTKGGPSGIPVLMPPIVVSNPPPLVYPEARVVLRAPQSLGPVPGKLLVRPRLEKP